jgi:type I restriction enzyme S subunit
MKEWKKYKLGEILTVKYGKDHKKLDAGSIPVYGSGGLMRFVNSYICDSPSILIPRKGSLNNVMYVEHPFWTVDTMFWTIIDTTIAVPRFVYYAICKIDFESLNVGSAVPSMTVPIIEDIEIFLPSLDEQKRIVKVLSSLESKIELNRQINDNLEQQAQALYKYWFIDFEPFKDGKFIESELGQIPEGWRIYTLNELMDIKRGSSPRPIQSYLSETGLKWLKISDATSCSSPFIYEIQEHIKSEGLRNTVYLQKGALVLSNSATPGLPKILGIDTCIHDGWLYFPISKLSNPFMYLMFIKFRENLISQANGSVFMNLKTEIVKNLKIALPKRETIEQFDLIISSVFNEIRNRTEEMLNLSKQRDTLLPKLMSGEIKINEIDC